MRRPASRLQDCERCASVFSPLSRHDYLPSHVLGRPIFQETRPPAARADLGILVLVARRGLLDGSGYAQDRSV